MSGELINPNMPTEPGVLWRVMSGSFTIERPLDVVVSTGLRRPVSVPSSQGRVFLDVVVEELGSTTFLDLVREWTNMTYARGRKLEVVRFQNFTGYGGFVCGYDVSEEFDLVRVSLRFQFDHCRVGVDGPIRAASAQQALEGPGTKDLYSDGDYTEIDIGDDGVEDWIVQCNNCGAHAPKGSPVVHHGTCRPGEAKFWEEFYAKENQEIEDDDGPKPA